MFTLTEDETRDINGGCGRVWRHATAGLVLVVRISSTDVTDATLARIRGVIKRFAAHLRDAPEPFHLVFDLHRTLEIPMDRLMELNEYVTKKEKYFRPSIRSTTYVVQGRIVAAAIEAMLGMFEKWRPRQILMHYPSAKDDEGGCDLPPAIVPKVDAFVTKNA